MKTFSRISLLFTLVLGFAVLLLGNTADVHAQQQENSLEVAAITGLDQEHPIGSEVSVHFTAKIGVAPAAGVELTITHSGLANVSVPSGGTVATSPTGRATVKGTITDQNAWVRAVWLDANLLARADLIPDEDTAPLLIVVKSPKLVHPHDRMQIGATFTQDITIENRDTRRESKPLSAWQMDVVFNSLILAIAKNEDGSPAIEFGDALGAGAPPTVVTNDMVSHGRIRVSQSRAGKPGIVIGPRTTKKLLTITFKVLAVAEEPLGIHNVRLQSSDDNADLDGDKDPDPNKVLDRIPYSILISDVFVTTHQSSEKVDVNQDGTVNILDLVMVASNIAAVPHNPRADVNNDGFVNVLDLVEVHLSPLWGKDVDIIAVHKANEPALEAPSMSRNVDPATIQTWIDLAQVADDGSAIFDSGIANLQALLVSKIPNKTRLLLNYPNPFNPETWIPYQLAKASDVTVTIHAMNGSLIRTLALGHQAAGIYQSKNQAAYWDGRNELGEQVASGLYFYTLTAGNFSATGKMLVRK